MSGAQRLPVASREGCVVRQAHSVRKASSLLIAGALALALESGGLAPAAAPVQSFAGLESSRYEAPLAATQPAPRWDWFLPGQPLLEAPETGAQSIVTLSALAYLPILELDGQWAYVTYKGYTGWSDTEWEPPFDRGKARQGILRHRAEPVRGNDPWRLKAAQDVLGQRSTEVAVGGYRLYTNVPDEDLLAFLNDAATAAERGYFARYGRLPSGDPVRSVVLFATEDGYRRFAATQNSANPGTNIGHAGAGVLAFYAEGRRREDLVRTLVHEITHLLNDRSLARALPPWLEEGTAEDLGDVWFEPFPLPAVDGELSNIASVGVQAFERRVFFLEGPLRAKQLPHVGRLITLDYEAFHQPGVESGAYAHSVAFVRYLLDGEDGRWTEGFREFLGKIATGTPANLLDLLDCDADTLDAGLRGWLPGEGQAARDRLMNAYPGLEAYMGEGGRLTIRRPRPARRPPPKASNPKVDPTPGGKKRKVGGLPAIVSEPGAETAKAPELVMLFRPPGMAAQDRNVVDPVLIGDAPDYRALITASSAKGMLAILARVDTSGAVVDANIDVGVHPDIDAALLDDVRTWRFMPGTVDGTPSEFTMRVILFVE